MESSGVFLLLIGIGSVLSYGDPKCCSDHEVIYFTMNRGMCFMVGAEVSFRETCTIDLCADGSYLKYYEHHCGKGDCTWRGCNCTGGCRTGKFSETFLKQNTFFDITIKDKFFYG